MSKPERALRPDRSARDRFGYELRQWRKRAGYSQDRLGERAFVSGDLIHKIEVAQRRPSRDLAVACDGFLGADGEIIRAWDAFDAEQAANTRGAEPAPPAQVIPGLSVPGLAAGVPVIFGEPGTVAGVPGNSAFPVILSGDFRHLADEGVLVWVPVRRQVFLRDDAGAGDTFSDAVLSHGKPQMLRTPWTIAGTLASADQISEGDLMDRRSFVLMAGAMLAVPAHDWLIAPAAGDVSSSAGRLIKPELVDDLDYMASSLRRMDDQVGGGSLVRLVRAQAGYVAALLRDGRYTDSVGRRLHGTLAELLRLGGWVSFDGSYQAQAQHFWIAALHAAHTAGDRALGANILGFMSEQAWNLGELDDSVRLASSALAGYKGSSPRVSAILHMRSARANAEIGNATECKRAIGAACDALTDVPSESGEPDWSYWMDEQSLNEQIGKCLIHLSEYETACAYLEMSLNPAGNWQGQYVRDGVSVLIALAQAHARAGEPEHACAIGGQAIAALSGKVDSPRLAAKIGVLREDLSRYENVPAVRDFGELAREISAAAR